MNRVIIYGCGNVGKTAYTYLKDMNEILFFVDRNAKEIGEIQEFKLPVYEPKELLNYQGGGGKNCYCKYMVA